VFPLPLYLRHEAGAASISVVRLYLKRVFAPDRTDRRSGLKTERS
jgi:hypothetical protein